MTWKLTSPGNCSPSTVCSEPFPVEVLQWKWNCAVLNVPSSPPPLTLNLPLGPTLTVKAWPLFVALTTISLGIVSNDVKVKLPSAFSYTQSLVTMLIGDCLDPLQALKLFPHSAGPEKTVRLYEHFFILLVSFLVFIGSLVCLFVNCFSFFSTLAASLLCFYTPWYTDLPTPLSIHLYVCLSGWPTVCLCVWLSDCLSIILFWGRAIDRNASCNLLSVYPSQVSVCLFLYLCCFSLAAFMLYLPSLCALWKHRSLPYHFYPCSANLKNKTNALCCESWLTVYMLDPFVCERYVSNIHGRHTRESTLTSWH